MSMNFQPFDRRGPAIRAVGAGFRQAAPLEGRVNGARGGARGGARDGASDDAGIAAKPKRAQMSAVSGPSRRLCGWGD